MPAFQAGSVEFDRLAEVGLRLVAASQKLQMAGTQKAGGLAQDRDDLGVRLQLRNTPRRTSRPEVRGRCLARELIRPGGGEQGEIFLEAFFAGACLVESRP